MVEGKTIMEYKSRYCAQELGKDTPVKDEIIRIWEKLQV
jgi:hypothetical protein